MTTKKKSCAPHVTINCKVGGCLRRRDRLRLARTVTAPFGSKRSVRIQCDVSEAMIRRPPIAGKIGIQLCKRCFKLNQKVPSARLPGPGDDLVPERKIRSSGRRKGRAIADRWNG